MTNFQMGLSMFFPPEIVKTILEIREEKELYPKALAFAYMAQKYGNNVDPDLMTMGELVTWYKQSLCTG
jgi:hypothetical protein